MAKSKKDMDKKLEEDLLTEEEAENNKQEEVDSDQDRDEGGQESLQEDSSEQEKDKKDEDDDSSEQEEKYLRLFAEFQNYKRRTEEGKAKIYASANEALCTDLLTVIDNFERALDQDITDGLKAYHEGMELIFKQFMDVLKAAGLEEIPAEGEDFDPRIHHAVLTVEGEEGDSDKVAEVLQKGYKLNGKVIRASMVKVYS